MSDATPPVEAPAPADEAPAAAGLPPSPLDAAPAADDPAAGGDAQDTQAGGEDAKPAADEVERVGAPEAYEFTPPEDVKLNEAQYAQWQEVARKAGVTQKQFAALTQDAIGMVNAMHAEQAKAWEATRAGWLADLPKLHPDIVGTTPGQLKPEAQALATQAMNALGGDALKQALAVTGAEYHPAVIKALVDVGRLLGQAPTVDVAGKPAGLTERELLDRTYPSMARRE